MPGKRWTAAEREALRRAIDARRRELTLTVDSLGRRRARRTLTPEHTVRHGTAWAYKQGCGCKLCLAAESARRAYRFCTRKAAA